MVGCRRGEPGVFWPGRIRGNDDGGGQKTTERDRRISQSASFGRGTRRTPGRAACATAQLLSGCERGNAHRSLPPSLARWLLLVPRSRRTPRARLCHVLNRVSFLAFRSEPAQHLPRPSRPPAPSSYFSFPFLQSALLYPELCIYPSFKSSRPCRRLPDARLIYRPTGPPHARPSSHAPLASAPAWRAAYVQRATRRPVP